MTLANLFEMSGQRGRSSHSKTNLYAYQLLRAVGHILGLGIAHRDIKPQNALINPNSEDLASHPRPWERCKEVSWK